jgi:hypothetical protein
MTKLVFHLCLIVLLHTSHSENLVSGRLKPRFKIGNTNVRPGFPSVSANSNIPLGSNTNLGLGGKFNYMDKNFQAGADFNHQSSRGNNFGLGANYNSANRAANIGANYQNNNNNFNAGVGYNTANRGVDASVNWKFGRRGAPSMQRFAHPEVGVARSFLQDDLRLLQKTVGSRHPELLKVNLTDEVDPETYSSFDLIGDLQSIQKQLGNVFPRLLDFMTRLERRHMHPAEIMPMPAIERPDEVMLLLRSCDLCETV